MSAESRRETWRKQCTPIPGWPTMMKLFIPSVHRIFALSQVVSHSSRTNNPSSFTLKAWWTFITRKKASLSSFFLTTYWSSKCFNPFPQSWLKKSIQFNWTTLSIGENIWLAHGRNKTAQPTLPVKLQFRLIRSGTGQTGSLRTGLICRSDEKMSIHRYGRPTLSTVRKLTWLYRQMGFWWQYEHVQVH